MARGVRVAGAVRLVSSCEKCWSDAHRGPDFSVSEEYGRLMDERRLSPCTPEEQAGVNAMTCPGCARLTLHQHTLEPMCGCEPPPAYRQRGH